MMKPIDVKHINPFLQSAISIVEQTTMMKMGVGKPVVSVLEFGNDRFILQVGVTGVLKGQVLIVMSTGSAKNLASKMMMGMPVEQLDEMASSALCELSNMVMGNAATIFSTQGIHMDITPPMAVSGDNLKMQTNVQALSIPLSCEGTEIMSLYLCVSEDA